MGYTAYSKVRTESCANRQQSAPPPVMCLRPDGTPESCANRHVIPEGTWATRPYPRNNKFMVTWPSLLPPPEYDKSYTGKLTVERGLMSDVMRACKTGIKDALGCAQVYNGGSPAVSSWRPMP
jgi:hypothetical protein